jgi:hypothetical protein
VRIWFDTEFDEDGRDIRPISIGAVREDGEVYYAEFDFDRDRVNPWVLANVVPQLTGEVKSRDRVAADLVDFARPDGQSPEWWAYYAAYDWVLLCQLYGPMLARPDGWPMFCRDAQQVADAAGIRLSQLHPQHGVEHNALEDALWLREAHLALDSVLAERTRGRGTTRMAAQHLDERQALLPLHGADASALRQVLEWTARTTESDLIVVRGP